MGASPLDPAGMCPVADCFEPFVGEDAATGGDVNADVSVPAMSTHCRESLAQSHHSSSAKPSRLSQGSAHHASPTDRHANLKSMQRPEENA